MVERVDWAGKDMAIEARMLEAVLAADCATRHEKFQARRERVQSVCEYCAHVAASHAPTLTTRVVRQALPAAGMAIVPLAMWRLGAAGTEVPS